jgi:hypothetical protein
MMSIAVEETNAARICTVLKLGAMLVQFFQTTATIRDDSRLVEVGK